MELQRATVTEIYGVVTVYSEKGRYDRMERRPSYGLSLCSEGQITYIQNGTEYVSNPGCVVLLPKGGTYGIRRDQTGRFPVINFDCLEQLCDTVTVLPIQESRPLLADCERLKKLIPFDGNRTQRFSIFYGMLHRICSDSIPSALRGAVQLISQDACDPALTNARLAAECHISEVYFRKLFTRHFGMSPKQFLIDARLQKAKQLLSEGGTNISAISERCGFSNVYHFCRLFRQHTGMTPSAYRKATLTSDI